MKLSETQIEEITGRVLTKLNKTLRDYLTEDQRETQYLTVGQLIEATGHIIKKMEIEV